MVLLRYKVLDPIGQGAYGVVCAVVDMATGHQYAIKKIENAFEHTTFTKRTLRELRILRNLRHENVIDIKEIFIADSKKEFQDIYVVNELMETDLASILKSGQPISDDHCQFFLYQILRGGSSVF
jgi:serine/threonine protein kinase